MKLYCRLLAAEASPPHTHTHSGATLASLLLLLLLGSVCSCIFRCAPADAAGDAARPPNRVPTRLRLQLKATPYRRLGAAGDFLKRRVVGGLAKQVPLATLNPAAAAAAGATGGGCSASPMSPKGGPPRDGAAVCFEPAPSCPPLPPLPPAGNGRAADACGAAAAAVDGSTSASSHSSSSIINGSEYEVRLRPPPRAATAAIGSDCGSAGGASNASGGGSLGGGSLGSGSGGDSGSPGICAICLVEFEPEAPTVSASRAGPQRAAAHASAV